MLNMTSGSYGCFNGSSISQSIIVVFFQVFVSTPKLRKVAITFYNLALLSVVVFTATVVFWHSSTTPIFTDESTTILQDIWGYRYIGSLKAFLSDARLTESEASSLLKCWYQICVIKCLYSYSGNFSELLGKTTAHNTWAP